MSEVKASTPSQTAWALLGLMAAGEVNERPRSPAASSYLMAQGASATAANGTSDHYNAASASRGSSTCATTATAAYFPLWALARYRNRLMASQRHGRVDYGDVTPYRNGIPSGR